MTRAEMNKAKELAKEFSDLYLGGVVDIAPRFNEKYEKVPKVHIHIKDFFELYGDREFQYANRADTCMEAQIMDDDVFVMALVDRYEYPKRSEA